MRLYAEQIAGIPLSYAGSQSLANIKKNYWADPCPDKKTAPKIYQNGDEL
ncbi:MAG: hypothetical protein PHT95_03485 [Candidatus Omnitrophica bacterium]|nr:hypothetical protein [Candidatus Omnitrophota bacterium]